MFEVLTINIAVEIFGLFFCLVCLCISAFSKNIGGRQRAVMTDIRNLFVCDACVMFSDAMAGLFRGKLSTAAFYIVHIGNFMLFLLNYVMFGLMVNLITHLVPSAYETRLRRIAWCFTGFGFLLLCMNIFTGKLYFFTNYNIYTRGEWFPLSQIIGLAYVVISIAYIVRFRKNAQPRALLLFFIMALLVIAALIMQILFYGIAWLNIAVLVGMVIIFIYNQMSIAESLAQKQKALAEQALLLEQSRTQLMMSQIKPHFLYNSLTAIAQLCEDAPMQAKELTIAFAKYLRLNMRSLEQTAPIPFADELTHIQYYLKIEQVRFGSLLHVEYDIETTDFRLPCLTVQPLIENAVKHGIGKKRTGGTVRLSVQEKETCFVITVTDDGVGFDANMPKNEQSYGIKNIEERLKRISHASLSFNSKIGSGTTATITLPKERHGKAGLYGSDSRIDR